MNGKGLRYGTGSGSDRVALGDACSAGTRSLPLPAPYRFIQFLVRQAYLTITIVGNQVKQSPVICEFAMPTTQDSCDGAPEV